MPTKSPAQHRLMEAAAHTEGGFGGVSQAVGKEFVNADDLPDWLDQYLAWALLKEGNATTAAITGDAATGFRFMAADKALVGPFATEEIARRAAALLANPRPVGLAYDKSARTIDADGRMHLDLCNISKAMVSPYKGSEIPNAEALGLDLDKVYQLLRDPGELEKAAATFNNLPLMIEHVPVSAEDHPSNLVVGTTGSVAKFVAPYLVNSLAVWTAEAIDEVESEAKKELSCGYHYTPDMTPGEYEGVKYDGVMRNIIGNHVSLVKEGRAGPDVMVEDSAMKFALDEVKHDPSNGQFSSGGGSGGSEEKKKIGVAALKTKLESMKHADLHAALKNPDVDPAVKKHVEKELDSRGERGTTKGFGEANDSTFDELTNLLTKETDMKVKPLSRTAILLRGALTAHLAPMMAKDKAFDLFPILTKINRKNLLAADKKTFKADAVKMIVKLAKDAAMPGMMPEAQTAMAAAPGTGATPDDAMIAIINALAPQIEAEMAAGVPDEAAALPGSAAMPVGEDPDQGAMKKKVMDWAASKGISGDDMSELEGMFGAEDEDETPEEKKAREAKEATDKKAKDEGESAMKPDMVDKKAMDAALAKTAADTTAAVLKTQREIRDAERAVFPYIGEIAVAQDSAAAVYKLAFDAMGVKIEGVHTSAYPAMLAMVPKPGDGDKKPTASVALDAKSLTSYDAMFGNDRVTHL